MNEVEFTNDKTLLKKVDEEIKERKIQEEKDLLEKYNFKCKSCGSNFEEKPNKCSCGGKNFKELTKYSEQEFKESFENFKNPELLKLIYKELCKKHIGDTNVKLTTFMTCVSGLLKNQKRRMSQAITAYSSEGKDNNIKTNLSHMPKESYIFLTSGTQSTIEDDIKDKRIIAFSEVNANREAGANKFLIEIIKQKTEGGTSSIKKDIRDGMKTARHEEGEQCTILYGTTEASMDEEMQTRFIKTTIETDSQRIKAVNDNTLDTFSDLDKLLNDSKQKDSWIKIGLTSFFERENQPEIFIPYAKFLKEKIGNTHIFDNANPRSQRDIKRVLALTCAMTYLFQEQREMIKHNNQNILISEPQDFINVLKISSEFFNQSYSGLDKRLTNVLKEMNDTGQEWISRDFLQNSLNVSRNTIKTYCHTLADEGLIEGNSGKELNEKEGIKIYDGNKIYYRRCQKGGKKPLIRCEINELKTFLEEKTKKTIDTFEINELSSINKDFDTLKGVKNEGVKIEENETDTLNLDNFSKIDTFELTPSKNQNSEEDLTQ